MGNIVSKAIFLKPKDVFKSGDQTLWSLSCFQTSVNEEAEVSHSGLLCVIRETRAAFSLLFLLLCTIVVILADYLLIQLLEVRPGAVGGAQSPVMSANKPIRLKQNVIERAR